MQDMGSDSFLPSLLPSPFSVSFQAVFRPTTSLADVQPSDSMANP